jgi:hypothetical protein
MKNTILCPEFVDGGAAAGIVTLAKDLLKIAFEQVADAIGVVWTGSWNCSFPKEVCADRAVQVSCLRRPGLPVQIWAMPPSTKSSMPLTKLA